MTSPTTLQQEPVFHNILALISCPPHLDVALAHALRLAVQAGAVLHLAGREWVAAGAQQPQREIGDLVLDWNIASVRMRALEASDRLQGVRHRIHSSPFGRCMDLGALVRRERIDLVVIESRGSEYALAGCASTPSLINAAGCPVLVMGPGVAAGEPGSRLQRVMCACDFSPAAGDALEYACRLAWHFGGRLLATHVVQSQRADDRSRLPEAESGLRELVTGATRSGLQAELAVQAGDAADVIARLAHDRQADLVVLGFAPDTPAAHTRATSWSVIRSVTCPVLLVPANRHGRTYQAAA